MPERRNLCLVGGANGLIGSHIAKNFIDTRTKVIGLDRQVSQNEFENIKVDLASEQEVIEVFSSIFKQGFYHNVILVNCQGIADPLNGDLRDLKLATWRKYLDSNINSFFLTSRELLRYSGSFEKASIINLSSTRRFMAESNTEAYSTTKGAIYSFTKALAISCSNRNIRVNSVSPGWIDDPDKKFSEKDKRQHPVNRVGTPEDIFRICQYLSCEDSGFVTGQDFIIDGGMSSKMIYD